MAREGKCRGENLDKIEVELRWKLKLDRGRDKNKNKVQLRSLGLDLVPLYEALLLSRNFY